MNTTREPALSRRILIRGARQLLTLQGPAGPRSGRAMGRLEVIQNGAMLIRDGVIECVGPANRVENLAEAKQAQEIDASGKVVMPAFVEPDSRILYDPVRPNSSDSSCHNVSQFLRISSKQKLLLTGISSSAEYARYGVLTAGVAAVFALELKVVVKILHTQHVLQSRPPRLRGIIAPDLCSGGNPEKMAEQVSQKWIPVVKARKLCSIVELACGGRSESSIEAATQTILLAAAAAGFAIRLRSVDGRPSVLLRAAQNAGAVALLAPARNELLSEWPAKSIMVFTLSTNLDMTQPCDSDPAMARKLIDSEVPVAISMGSPTADYSGRNTQHALYTACRHYKLTAEEAITAATVNAACSLRTSHITGTLEPGKSADVMVMDVPDYRELVRRPGMSNVEWALCKGVVAYGRTQLILD